MPTLLGIKGKNAPKSKPQNNPSTSTEFTPSRLARSSKKKAPHLARPNGPRGIQAALLRQHPMARLDYLIVDLPPAPATFP